MTKDEAFKKFETKWWEKAGAQEIVEFQLFEDRLCMPFDLFQAAVEKVLGRPVWTHEFADPSGMRHEYHVWLAKNTTAKTKPSKGKIFQWEIVDGAISGNTVQGKFIRTSAIKKITVETMNSIYELDPEDAQP